MCYISQMTICWWADTHPHLKPWEFLVRLASAVSWLPSKPTTTLRQLASKSYYPSRCCYTCQPLALAGNSEKRPLPFYERQPPFSERPDLTPGLVEDSFLCPPNVSFSILSLSISLPALFTTYAIPCYFNPINNSLNFPCSN